MKLFFKTLILLGFSIFVVSCVNLIKGYEWLEGQWVSGEDSYDKVCVNITKSYIQFVGELWNDDMNLDNADKQEFTIQIVHNSFIGDVKAICIDDHPRFYIDESRQEIFWLYDFDVKMYLSKDSE